LNRKNIFKIVRAQGISPGEMVLVHFWGEDVDKDTANNFMVQLRITLTL
jgi:hypothetical protein